MPDRDRRPAVRATIDRERFGPWAVVTGASSGIGREFARQIAASGINVVLVARREALLKQVGEAFAKEFGVAYRAVAADLSEDGFIPRLAAATADIDIGLVVSNAGTGDPGPFLQKSRDAVTALLRLNTLAHLDIALHFGRRLAARKSGGLLFVGAMGADKGIPMMANDAGGKAYVQSFALSLHDEFRPLGVHVTVLPPGPTDTPVLEKFGLDPAAMPMKPMPVERCVGEGLRALAANRAMIIPGRLNRIMNAVIPAPVARAMMARVFAAGVADRG
jgi:short-subunit dehydrogenase